MYYIRNTDQLSLVIQNHFVDCFVNLKTNFRYFEIGSVCSHSHVRIRCTGIRYNTRVDGELVLKHFAIWKSDSKSQQKCQ